MTSDGAGQIDWQHPIPGDARLVQGELDRLHAMRQRCRASSAQLRSLDLSGWEGVAAEAFDAVLRGQANQWQEAEDAVGVAFVGLETHLNSLVALQELADEAVREARASGNWPGVVEDVIRWREQAAAQEWSAATLLDRAAVALRSITRLVDPFVPDPVPSEPPPVESITQEPTAARATPAAPTEPEITQRVTQPPLILGTLSPDDLLGFTTSLCDALRGATFVSLDLL